MPILHYKASLGVHLGTRDANLYEQEAQRRGLRIQVGRCVPVARV